MENTSSISDLTDDCLINIFKHCDVQSLGRVASTCKRMKNIVNNCESLWLPKSKTVLGSNMNSPLMVKRSMPVLTPIQRCKVSRNWMSGVYEMTSVMKYVQCLPWLCMEQEYLFVSKCKKITKLFRGEDGHILSERITGTTHHEDDVSKFVINGDEIFSVGWDGKLCRYMKSTLDCVRSQRLHANEVLAIDSKNDIVATGSRDKTIKVWKIGPSYTPLKEVCEFTTDVRVLCVSLLQSTSYLVAGLPGIKGIHPLPMYDIEKAKLVLNFGEEFVKGGGIIDIYPESENLILTCGYDTTVKLWDVRTPKTKVSEWVEPYDNILYSVKSDHSFTIVAGANRSGYIHVWDKRTSNVIQTYHDREFSSPVYCLQFDAAHVFSALNRALLQYCFMPNSSAT